LNGCSRACSSLSRALSSLEISARQLVEPGCIRPLTVSRSTCTSSSSLIDDLVMSIVPLLPLSWMNTSHHQIAHQLQYPSQEDKAPTSTFITCHDETELETASSDSSSDLPGRRRSANSARDQGCSCEDSVSRCLPSGANKKIWISTDHASLPGRKFTEHRCLPQRHWTSSHPRSSKMSRQPTVKISS
jgi:hypothetical protein